MSLSKKPAAVLGLTLAMSLVSPSAAFAHTMQDGGSDGHLPAKVENVRLVGSANITDRTPNVPPPGEGDESPTSGRVADVNVFGNYAYLAAFREPTCEDGGVFVIDVTDPTNPAEVEDAFIPTAAGSFVGEGVQIIEIGAMDVLLFNNEICADGGEGGISLFDVTDPLNAVPLAENVGDVTGDGTDPEAVTPVHQVHSVFGWADDGETYAALVDDEEADDIDIFNITNPASPTLVSETSFVDDARVRQEENTPNGDTQFFHDLVVKEIGGVQTMLASYWDNGYLQVNVEDPATPTLIRDSDFAAEEPFAEQLNLEQGTVPEGNGHQAEFSPDNQFVIGTDEDFGPFRLTAEITSGPNDGRTFSAVVGSGTPPVNPDTPLNGATDFVGRGCPAAAGAMEDPYPPKESPIAVIERGGCTFQAKYDRAVAAGYEDVIVMNSAMTGCEGLINPLVEGDMARFVFVNRPDGLRILNQTPAEDPCTQPSPEIGGATGDISVESVFDGWGYVHLFNANDMSDIDQYAIPESLDINRATDSGDLSVHEVAMDEKIQGRAYISYYSGGFRVVDYDSSGIREVGAYIEEGGSNIWGVQTWTSPTTGEDYVLASDRDAGLRIFQFDGPPPGGPDPVIPEAPSALLLPLAALVMIGGATVIRRRRAVSDGAMA